MKIIKIILALLGIVFGVMLMFWLFGVVWALLGYAFWLAVVGAIGYGAYKLLTRGQNKQIDSSVFTEIEGRDYSLSWEDYDRKYLKK
ncbi:MAG: hypothetical protein KF855_15420 [Acidobacteria bacterium]|nr:hypothetical protein [Acidobacteriota bacterium]